MRYVLLGIFLFSICAYSQTQYINLDTVKTTFVKIPAFERFEPDSFCFASKLGQFKICSDGRFFFKDNTNAIKRSKLRVSKDYFIEQLFVANIEDKIMVLFLESDNDCAGGRLAKIDAARLSVEWTKVIPGFNLAEPLVVGKYLYLSCIGWVGKMETKTGKFEWQHANLYENNTGHFNDFEKAYIKDSVVYFSESRPSFKDKTKLTITIDDKTGKIIKKIRQD